MPDCRQPVSCERRLSVVLLVAASFRAASTTRSESLLRAEVASPSNSKARLRTYALEIAIRWHWPPEIVKPENRTGSRTPSGNDWMKPRVFTCRHAIYLAISSLEHWAHGNTGSSRALVKCWFLLNKGDILTITPGFGRLNILVAEKN